MNADDDGNKRRRNATADNNVDIITVREIVAVIMMLFCFNTVFTFSE